MSETKPGIFQRVQNFVQEVRNEMTKVTWPTKEELYDSTQVTLILLAAMAVIVFFFDQFFQTIVIWLLSLAA